MAISLEWKPSVKAQRLWMEHGDSVRWHKWIGVIPSAVLLLGRLSFRQLRRAEVGRGWNQRVVTDEVARSMLRE